MELSLFTKLKIAGYVIKQLITKPTFNKYNPDDTEDYYKNPNPINLEMLTGKKIFFAPRIAAWVLSLDRDGLFEFAKDERFSVSFKDWRFAPAVKPESEQDDLEKLISGLLMSMDRGDHRRIRRLVQPAFSPRNIHKMQDIVDRVVDEAIETIRKKTGPFNLADITAEIPLKITSELVGVDTSYRKEFKGLADAIMATYAPEGDINYSLAKSGIDTVKAVILDRRENPRDDFISVLVQTADEDGDRLSIEEVMAFVASLMTAGPDTTQHFLNFAIQTFITHPDVIPQINENPQIIDDAITEALRMNYFSHSGGVRFAREDVELEEQKIKKGEMIKFNVNAGNIDPDTFEDPLRFDITRKNLNDVFIFGSGSHFCVAAALAKAIGRTFALKLLSNFPTLRLMEDPTYEKDFISRKMVTFMVEY